MNEIGGPRASAKVLSHMTAEWKGEVSGNPTGRSAQTFSHKPQLIAPSVLPLELYADVYVADRAQAYLQDYDDERPWCCWLSFGGPHEPWDAPEPYASAVNPADMPSAIAQPAESPDRGLLPDHYKKTPELSDEYIASMRANYAANVKLIDDQIAKLVATIKERGEGKTPLLSLPLITVK